MSTSDYEEEIPTVGRQTRDKHFAGSMPGMNGFDIYPSNEISMVFILL